MEFIQKLIDEGKIVSFYKSPDQERGLYVCEIHVTDEDCLLYADTIAELLHKLERKDIA